MSKTNLSPSKLIWYAKAKLIFFTSINMAVGIMTPHLFDGHLFVKKEYAQSALIFLDFGLMFFIIWQYIKDLKKIDEHRKYADSLLDRSHRFLGLTNRKISVLTDFINKVPESTGILKPKEIIEHLTRYLLVSVLQVSYGKLRIINKETLRTLAEWSYGSKKSIRGLSNKSIAENDTLKFNRNYRYVISTYGSDAVICVLIFPGKNGLNTAEEEFVRTLLNQICSIVFQLEIVDRKPYILG